MAFTDQDQKLFQKVMLPGRVKIPGNRSLGRLKAGEMNKTEKAYQETLELLKHAKEIIWYEFEAITFKIAKDTRYTPDFTVLRASGAFECHEVKSSYWEDDALVKIKVAARMFPFKFMSVTKDKETGAWITREF